MQVLHENQEEYGGQEFFKSWKDGEHKSDYNPDFVPEIDTAAEIALAVAKILPQCAENGEYLASPGMIPLCEALLRIRSHVSLLKQRIIIQYLVLARICVLLDMLVW